MKSWDKKLAIILPTYNESENLRILLKKIKKVLPNAHIIVVDDSNTRENIKLKKIIKTFSNTEIITRQKKLGRGSAVLMGFDHALKNKKIEYFVEMDTDLAHDPAEIVLLQKAIEKDNVQLVVGSRYIEKSNIVDWPLRRLIMSKIINTCLKYWLGIRLHDYTNGFRMYRRQAVVYLVKTGLQEKNFIALSESAFKIHKQGYEIVEVPISFTDRKHGESSVGIKELFNSLLGALRIKLRYNLAENNQHPYFPLSKLHTIILIVVIGASLRLWNINEMGRTWDERAYVEEGYGMVDSLLKGDFNNKELYHSDHPPLARYLYGAGEHIQVKDAPPFPYDYNYPRYISLVFSMLAVVVVVLIGWEFVSPFVGFTSGLIFSMIPFFLGFSQIATLESLNMFFFTAGVYSFLKLLQKYSKKLIVITGIAFGFALLVKQSNSMLYPLLGVIYIFWRYYQKVSLPLFNKYTKAILWIGIIALFTFFISWPFILLHLPEVIKVQDTMWVKNVALPPPEVFYGKLMLVPLPYYVIYFLITTPVLLLIFLMMGLLHIDKRKNWILFCLVIWFLFPFLQSFYTFKQHGVRYIIQIYAPMAIIAAIGFETFVSALTTSKWIKMFSLVALFFYMFFILYKATPYYLDYFNGVVGGTNNVYEKKLFQLGWWGQGLKESGQYLDKHAKDGSTIGLAVKPLFSFPLLKNKKVEEYSTKKEYDYVVVSYFLILREGFDDSVIKQEYVPVYKVDADRAVLVTVYKNKKKL